MQSVWESCIRQKPVKFFYETYQILKIPILPSIKFVKNCITITLTCQSTFDKPKCIKNPQSLNLWSISRWTNKVRVEFYFELSLWLRLQSSLFIVRSSIVLRSNQEVHEKISFVIILHVQDILMCILTEKWVIDTG